MKKENLRRLPNKETRGTLRLASQEAETAMLRVAGICNELDLLPADEVEVLHQVGRELEDASTRLYAMSVRGTKHARD
jgi:muconolactone delta-isomerase